MWKINTLGLLSLFSLSPELVSRAVWYSSDHSLINLLYVIQHHVRNVTYQFVRHRSNDLDSLVVRFLLRYGGWFTRLRTSFLSSYVNSWALIVTSCIRKILKSFSQKCFNSILYWPKWVFDIHSFICFIYFFTWCIFFSIPIFISNKC